MVGEAHPHGRVGVDPLRVRQTGGVSDLARHPRLAEHQPRLVESDEVSEARRRHVPSIDASAAPQPGRDVAQDAELVAAERHEHVVRLDAHRDVELELAHVGVLWRHVGRRDHRLLEREAIGIVEQVRDEALRQSLGQPAEVLDAVRDEREDSRRREGVGILDRVQRVSELGTFVEGRRTQQPRRQEHRVRRAEANVDPVDRPCRRQEVADVELDLRQPARRLLRHTLREWHLPVDASDEGRGARRPELQDPSPTDWLIVEAHGRNGALTNLRGR